MTTRLIKILLVVFTILALAGPYIAGAGMVAVDDEELAGVTAQTGIKIYGRLKATAGNLIIGGTAGSINLGNWYLNNSTTADGAPTSGNEGFSTWGPITLDMFTKDIGGANEKAVGRIGMETTSPYPTWIFKSIDIKNDGSTTWQDIGGLYLTSINLNTGSYIDLFNDEKRSISQIQAHGKFKGKIDRITLQYGSTFATDDCMVIENLYVCENANFTTSPYSGATGFLELGNTTFPFTWDQTGNFLNLNTTNSRIWFPFEGSLYWENMYIVDTTTTHHFGTFGLNHAYGGTITIDFEQKQSPASSWWQY